MVEGRQAALLRLQAHAAGTGREKKDAKDTAPNPYNFDAILAKVEGDVWHWNDPRIIPQQKMLWEREKD